MGKQAFLIQHIGPAKSNIRARADRVMTEIVEPACERMGYQLSRADYFPMGLIVEPIVSALASSPLAIADLGSPPWNENVLMEVGFRLANGKPIVYLADVEPSQDILPLHLKNKRIIRITDGSETIDQLSTYIEEERAHVVGWNSQYPTLDFKVPLLHPEASVFTYANDAAAWFYGFESVDDLLSASVTDADARLRGFMEPLQADRFSEEQEKLFGAALMNREVTASVPAWFTRHDHVDLNRKPFWPVLLSRRFSPYEDQSLVMRVAFVDLTEWFGPGQPGSSTFIKLPAHLRPRTFRYDIFLSYNSVDRPAVTALASAFKRFGLDVWFDEDKLIGRQPLYTEIRKAMSDSRIVCAVIGARGLGPWQDSVELSDELVSIARKNRPFAVLLLEDVDEVNDKWLEVLPEEFRPFFANRAYGKLRGAHELEEIGVKPDGATFIERIIRLFADTFKEVKDTAT